MTPIRHKARNKMPTKINLSNKEMACLQIKKNGPTLPSETCTWPTSEL